LFVSDKLLIATTNPGKLLEITPLLEHLPIELVTLAGFASIAAPEETGPTFEANARDKAHYYATATGLLTVAEDSGLEIDALGGQPGVESARFGGAHTPYPRKFSLIYEALASSGHTAAAARFVCALALADPADPAQLLFEARGTIEGRIAPVPAGQGGFGYDPIFFYPPFGCTLAEAPDRKVAVSHRTKAFEQLRLFLERRPRSG
jgi:XTP/dITP diphosphohydrolase